MNQFSPAARIAVLEDARRRTDERLVLVEADVDTIRDDVTVLKTKIAMHAALGGFAGGGIVSAVVAALAIFLH